MDKTLEEHRGRLAMAEGLDKQLLTVNEFAAIYNLGRSTAWQLLKDGVVPSVSVGSRRYIRKSDAETWCASLTPRRSPRAKPNSQSVAP